jgi:methylenetetrahydrofolate reductase (NADPH)
MSRGTPSTVASRGVRLPDVLASGARSYSFEFFPPKNAAGATALWQAIRRLESLHPTFVSVTYGAGGTNRGAVVDVTRRIGEETTLTPMAHLTCVGHSRAELRQVIGAYADAGVRNVLALRGDPPGGPGQPWTRHPDGFDHAVELVEFVRTLGGFDVAVAAFPDKHPEAASIDADAQVLVAKARAGAAFAVTQLFFDPDAYLALVDRVAAAGADIPIIPGIMPITNVRQIKKMALLSGAALPSSVLAAIEPYADDPAAVREIGIDLANRLCATLLERGAPGLHFYTLNRSNATRRIYAEVVGLPAETRPISAAASAAVSSSVGSPAGR